MNGFLGSHILEAAIGLSLVYLILALFCTTANEWIASLLNSRAAALRTAIHALLANQCVSERLFVEHFYAHPLIANLNRGSHPAYIPPRAFSNAVLDLVTPGKPGSIAFEDLKHGIAALPPGDVQTALLALIQNAEGDSHRAQANVEMWFNNAMDGASAWYKRRIQWITLVLAFGITVILNADTLAIIHRLWTAPAAALLGWDSLPHGTLQWMSRVSGFLLTTAAVSLGAPFWFDVLGRVGGLRGQGRTSESTAPVGLQDSTR